MIAKVLLAKYCKQNNFLEARVASCASWGWIGILWGRDLLWKGLKWKVGNGETINVFGDNWIPINSNNPFRDQNMRHMFPQFKVKDLFD